MTQAIELNLTNEWRGTMSSVDIPNMLVASAYLKYKNNDIFKTLMLQYKMAFLDSLEHEIMQEDNIPQLKVFLSRTKELIEKIDIELEKYVAPVPKKSMTMKERIDKAKTKLSEKKPQETELKNDKLSNHKIKGENE